MDKRARFWDRIADRYAKKPVADEEAYQKKLETTREYLEPDMRVLEIGCGTGSTALAHAPYVAHIRAADISLRMIEIAKEKAQAAGIGNVEFEQSAIDTLDVPDGSVDAVMAHSILHLVDDHVQVVADVYRMLRPGGVFVSSTVCLGDRMKWFKFVGPIGSFLGLIPKVAVFSAQDLLDSFSAAGFGIEHQWQPEKAVSVFVVAEKPR